MEISGWPRFGDPSLGDLRFALLGRSHLFLIADNCQHAVNTPEAVAVTALRFQCLPRFGATAGETRHGRQLVAPLLLGEALPVNELGADALRVRDTLQQIGISHFFGREREIVVHESTGSLATSTRFSVVGFPAAWATSVICRLSLAASTMSGSLSLDGVMVSVAIAAARSISFAPPPGAPCASPAWGNGSVN
jgi:hypothetical protein